MTRQASEAILAAAALGRELPEDLVDRICRRLETLGPVASAQAVRTTAGAAVAKDATQERVLAVVDLWTAADASPLALAAALRSASVTDAWWRANRRVELVWTGPRPASSKLRRIDQGLLDVVRAARERLLIVSYAFYKVPTVLEAMSDALDAGVRVDLILETEADSGGKLRGDVFAQLGASLIDRAQVWTWPRAKRDEGGLLHAKAAVADDALALVSSANFTGHAMALNMELGVLIDGGDLPPTVRGHFDALRVEGVLAECHSGSGSAAAGREQGGGS